MSIYTEDNISWAEDFGLDGYEPWAPDDDLEPEPAGGCAYCDSTEVREYPDPFGGQPCCDPCFSIIIGGNEGDPPWRCGNAPIGHAGASSVPTTEAGQ